MSHIPLLHYLSSRRLQECMLAVVMATTALLSTAPVLAADPVTLTVAGNLAQVQTQLAHERAVLRIAGPNGYALTLQLAEAYSFVEADLIKDAEPRMGRQSDAPQKWTGLPVGDYYYEVVLFAGGQRVGVTSGKFLVGEDGRAFEDASQPAVEELSHAMPSDGLLQRMLATVLNFLVPSAHADLFTTDVTIQKSAPAVIFDSTASAYTNWKILGNTASWIFQDLNNAQNVINIYPGSATANSMNISGDGTMSLRNGAVTILPTGNVGIGTAAPLRPLQLTTGDTPNIRLDQDNSSIWPPYAWDLAGNESNFFIRDVTGGSTLPFRIFPGAPTNSIVANTTGVGIGTSAPARQLHLKGTNAVFRMDRPSDTASFMLVRTDAGGSAIWKNFVVGTNASGSNNGEFIINDLGTADGGPGARRMTIGNTGNVTFTGSVTAQALYQSSSARFKKDIETLAEASEAVEKLRGVRFAWKDSGQSSVGLIAEEVAKIYPDLVEFENGEAKGVNYSALVAVLVEAMKEQHAEFEVAKKQQQVELETVSARLAALERLLIGKQAMLAP